MSNLAMVDQFLQAPFQRYCGLEVLESANGHCKAQLTVTDELTNMSGMLHGGVIHSMLDVVSFVAAMTAMNDDQYPVTHNINISIYRPVPKDHTIEFNASVRKRGKRLVVTHCEIIDLDNERSLVAEGIVTKSILNTQLNTVKGA